MTGGVYKTQKTPAIHEAKTKGHFSFASANNLQDDLSIHYVIINKQRKAYHKFQDAKLQPQLAFLGDWANYIILNLLPLTEETHSLVLRSYYQHFYKKFLLESPESATSVIHRGRPV